MIEVFTDTFCCLQKTKIAMRKGQSVFTYTPLFISSGNYSKRRISNTVYDTSNPVFEEHIRLNPDLSSLPPVEYILVKLVKVSEKLLYIIKNATLTIVDNATIKATKLGTDYLFTIKDFYWEIISSYPVENPADTTKLWHYTCNVRRLDNFVFNV